MAVAFLLNEEREVLFLQKRETDSFFAGFLVPIGGHIESSEINEPQNACFREIEEETGLKSNDIKNLTLRYIIHRNKENQEIRIQYVFFGNVSKNTTLIESKEGSLHWVSFKDIPSRNVSATTNEIVNHFNEIGESTRNVYVGAMSCFNGGPAINWGHLEDWEM
ncbi:NUDIX hydrolase [Ferdinandcohnia quinoae]|nr:NUDIX domain-containing protein [Fredinandcohnia sp. SECRCQ15]